MYNYRNEMKEDIRNYIQDEIDFEDFETIEDLEETLNDDLWTDDSVTGNASGSYTFNTYQAKENVVDNMDLVQEMAWAFGMPDIGEAIIEEKWEYVDVSIRCYLLGECIAEVIAEIEEDFEEAKAA